MAFEKAMTSYRFIADGRPVNAQSAIRNGAAPPIRLSVARHGVRVGDDTDTQNADLTPLFSGSLSVDAGSWLSRVL